MLGNKKLYIDLRVSSVSALDSIILVHRVREHLSTDLEYLWPF